MPKKKLDAQKEHELKGWIVSHAAKNELNNEMMEEMEIIKNRIDKNVSQIEHSRNDHPK